MHRKAYQKLFGPGLPRGCPALFDVRTGACEKDSMGPSDRFRFAPLHGKGVCPHVPLSLAEGHRGETAEDRSIIDRSLETADVADIADRQLNSLSGGERQKALIAAALAQSTDILFLDEPTSFLDYRHQVETLELIERVNREQGMTVLLVTHDINLALHGADEILAIKKGRMAWKGKSSELLEEGLLEEIFDTGFKKLHFGRAAYALCRSWGL